MLWLIYLLISAPMGVWMFKRQNSGKKLGGPISISKALWLYWTISVWFIMIPLALFQGDWPAAAWWGWGGFSLSFWIRGIAELYMLFVSKNWTPRIGITHDIVTCMGLVLAYILNWDSLAYSAWWIQLFSLGMVISICVETWYAWAFLQLMRERTKGKEGLWYATKEDPQFLFILRVTTTFNTILYAIVALFVWQWLS